MYIMYLTEKSYYHANAFKNMIVQLLDLMLAYNENW